MNKLLKYKFVLLQVFLFVLFLTACAKNQKTLTLDYHDFGPQAMSYELIGYDWWSWLDCHCEETAEQYPVQVIVYENITKEQLRDKFPINQQLGPDMRFIEYCDASNYLNAGIEEISKELNLSQLATQLNQTRTKLTVHFNSKRCY